jgi:hypothetical protein
MILGGVIISMCLMLLSPSSALATPLFEKASDTISDSDLGATGVTHTFLASTTAAIPDEGRFEIVFPGDFTNILVGGVTCPGGGTAGVNSQTVTCTYSDGGLVATSAIITVSNVTNPATAGSYTINLYTKQSGGTEIERSTVAVAIINDVTVTAYVEPYLTFFIHGIDTAGVINGVVTTGSSTFQEMAYGVLEGGVVETMGQGIEVTTNAPTGFSVTVSQDHNLLSGNGADIDSFKDGVPVSTAEGWDNPSMNIADEQTWGHLGVTSDDASLSGGNEYGTALYKGLNGTTPLEIMYNNGPADGLTDSVGSTTVAYTIEITDVQEMGDYSNTLTYVCTPTF